MRIGVNTLFLVPGDVGGTEVYLRENLKELIPANPQDTFVLFTSRDNDQSLKQDFTSCDNVEFVRLPFRAATRPLRIIAEQTMLPYHVWRQNIEVLWSPGYTAPLWSSCPQAVTIHDLQYKTYPEDVSFLERVTLDFLVKNACKRCDSIIAVSNFSKNEIIRFGFAPADKIVVIHEGVDLSFGESKIKNKIQALDLPNNIPFILCVAHTYPHKKVHILIEAFDRISKDVPHHLVLVGKPRRGESEVLKSLTKLDEENRVNRISKLQYSQLKTLYQSADLFVLPSEYEGFGLPILEALLAGLPVITTKNGSLPEVGGKSVQYLEHNTTDCLAKTIKNMLNLTSEERQSLVAGGISWAKNFSWNKSAQKTVAELHLLEQRNSSRKDLS